MAKFSEWVPDRHTLTTNADGSALTVGTDAYTALDVVGGLLSCKPNQRNGGGYVSSVTLVDDGAQTKGYTLWVFYEQPSAIADDAAFAPTEADLQKLVTVIELASGDVDETGDESHLRADGKDKTTGEYAIFPNLADGKLYFYLVDTDASNPSAADDISVQVTLMML